MQLCDAIDKYLTLICLLATVTTALWYSLIPSHPLPSPFPLPSHPLSFPPIHSPLPSLSCFFFQVLRTLLLSECGKWLTDDSVWDIFNACFNICFETKLSGIVLYKYVLHCIALHCIALHYIVLYCIVLCVLYCVVLYCVVLCCVALCCIVLVCIVLYCSVLYCIVSCGNALCIVLILYFIVFVVCFKCNKCVLCCLVYFQCLVFVSTCCVCVCVCVCVSVHMYR